MSYATDYHAKHRAERNAYSTRYVAEHKAERAAYLRAFNAQHPERAKNKRYPKDWPRIRKIVLMRDMYVCWICKGDRADSVDHVVRIIDGGSHELTNLRAAHLRCNIVRSARMKRRKVSTIRARVSRWG